MKKIILFVLTAVFFNACVLSANSTKSEELSFEANVNKSILKEVKKRTNELGFLELELVFQSNTKTRLDYKITWLDKDGFSLINAMNDSYERIILPSKERVIIRKIAQDIRAENFKIHFK